MSLTTRISLTKYPIRKRSPPRFSADNGRHFDIQFFLLGRCRAMESSAVQQEILDDSEYNLSEGDTSDEEESRLNNSGLSVDYLELAQVCYFAVLLMFVLVSSRK